MQLHNRILIFITVTAGLLASCTGSRAKPEETLTIFAAASLTESFNQIGTEFTSQHPDAKLYFNFAGSQQLAQQIAQGAPADVFASADQPAMLGVIQTGDVAEGSEHVFASNYLVVVCAPGNPGRIQAFSDLASPELRLLLAAENVPVGRYSRAVLENAGSLPGYPADFSAQVLERVVSFEETVRAVLTKVSLGEADAGIVYMSDLSSDTMKSLPRVEIPPEANVRAQYPIAVLNGSAYPALAQEFVDFVLSARGQEILKAYGFGPIPE